MNDDPVNGIRTHLRDHEQRLRTVEARAAAMENIAKGAFAVVGALISLLGILFFDMRSDLAGKVDNASRQELIENYRRDISDLNQRISEHERRDENQTQRFEKHFESNDMRIERLLQPPPWDRK